MSKIILKLLIVFIIQFESQCVYPQNVRCQKVDFNRPTSVVHEFDECVGSIPVFKINSYAATTIQPFRPDSEFHLSATDEGLSCLQSTSVFTLDENSEILTAIYLGMVTVGAWIEVQVFDRDDGEVMVMASLEESSDWILFSGKVNRTIEHAQVEIRANMNTGSILAIEFIYVLNSDSQDEECFHDTETDTDPPTDLTTDPNLTTDPTHPSTETTTEDPSVTETTILPTTPPSTSPQSDDYIWIILAIIFIVTTALSSVALIYFMWLYYSLMPLKSKLVPIKDKSETTLPRLAVKNSVYGEHVIVGIEQTK